MRPTSRMANWLLSRPTPRLKQILLPALISTSMRPPLSATTREVQLTEPVRRYLVKPLFLTKSGKAELSFFVKNPGWDASLTRIRIGIPFLDKHFGYRTVRGGDGTGFELVIAAICRRLAARD